jgi:hypothetical protein
VIAYFLTEEDSPEEEMEETSNYCENIASLLLSSMGITFDEIDGPNSFKISLKLEEIEKFIPTLLGRTVIGD